MTMVYDLNFILHFVYAYYTLSTHITFCIRILHFVYAYYTLYTHITLCIRILHLYTYFRFKYVSKMFLYENCNFFP